MIRRRREFLGLSLFACVLVVIIAVIARQRKSVHEHSTNMSTSNLIDQLVGISSEGVGSHSTASFEGFVALDDDPRFHGGVLGSNKPEVSPIVQELVRRGLTALPDLIDHLGDGRSTRVTAGKDFPFMASWFGGEYESRYFNSQENQEIQISLDKLAKNEFELPGNKYTLRVGDLCFVIIGQIVNRNLSAVRYQPSACLVVNSPVATPGLATAIHKDWSGLTPESHRQSLANDAMDPDPDRTEAAIKRLWYYYPDSGEKLAGELLSRPLFAFDSVWKFALRLVEKEKPADWELAISEFRKQEGQAAIEALPYWIHWIYWLTSVRHDESYYANRKVATRLLAERFASFDPQQPRIKNAMIPKDAAQLVRAIACIHTVEIDKSVYGLFCRASALRAVEDYDLFLIDSLAEDCMDRLSGKEYDAEFRAFCERRIRAIESSGIASSQRRNLHLLQTRLGNLRSR